MLEFLFQIAFRDSWKKLGDMPQQDALGCYIQELYQTDPEWEAKYVVTDDLVCCRLSWCNTLLRYISLGIHTHLGVCVIILVIL